jgi:hypothetical protein
MGGIRQVVQRQPRWSRRLGGTLRSASLDRKSMEVRSVLQVGTMDLGVPVVKALIHFLLLR